MGNTRKLLKTCGMFMLVMLLFTTGCAEKNDEGTKYEVDGVIFDNDLISITGVSTDEYLEAFETQEVLYSCFATDMKVFNAANIIDLGGAAIQIAPGEDYLEELPCSNLLVIENHETTLVTDKLEEFFICEDENGNRTLYYEIYHLYDEKEEKETVTKYLTLKAYKIEFKYYLSISQPKIEVI